MSSPEAANIERSTMDRTTIELLSAKDAGTILGINPNAVYRLWMDDLLDFWCINGTKKTNLQAIVAFLDRTRNTTLQERGGTHGEHIIP